MRQINTKNIKVNTYAWKSQPLILTINCIITIAKNSSTYRNTYEISIRNIRIITIDKQASFLDQSF